MPERYAIAYRAYWRNRWTALNDYPNVKRGIQPYGMPMYATYGTLWFTPVPAQKREDPEELPDVL